MIDSSCKKSGQRVRIIRKELGLTQQELADKLGLCDGKYISQIEIGKRKLPPAHAQTLCEIAAQPASYRWLVGETDYRTDTEKILHELAETVVDNNTRNEAVFALAYRMGYIIIPPDLKNVRTKSELEKMNRFFVAKDGKMIDMSIEEMNHLENLISAIIKIQLEFLFNTKRVITNRRTPALGDGDERSE